MKKNEIKILATYNSPPSNVKLVLSIIVMLINYENKNNGDKIKLPTWKEVKSKLKDNFLKCISNIYKNLKNKDNNNSFIISKEGLKYILET